MDIACVDGGGSITLSEQIFDRPYNESLIHQFVVAYAGGSRQGTHAQKTRSQVAGGGHKPWRQKGTGRARAGTSRSPIWRGGGRAFAKTQRDYSQKLNKKMYRAAMQSLLSQLLREKKLDFISSKSLQVAEPKVKVFLQNCGSLLGKTTTIVVSEIIPNLLLATRNLPHVEVISVSSLNPHALIHSSKVLVEEQAAQQLEKHWQ